MKFGDPKLLEFGLIGKFIPRFRRIYKNYILGLENFDQTGLILDELNVFLGLKTKFKDDNKPKYEPPTSRYFTISSTDQATGKDYIDQSSQNLDKPQPLEGEFIAFYTDDYITNTNTTTISNSIDIENMRKRSNISNIV